MTRLEELCLRLATRRYGGKRRLGYLQELYEAGLIDRRACERTAIRVRMEELETAGRPRCEAMVIAAREFCCSYEKIRKAFYDGRGKLKTS